MAYLSIPKLLRHFSLWLVNDTDTLCLQVIFSDKQLCAAPKAPSLRFGRLLPYIDRNFPITVPFPGFPFSKQWKHNCQVHQLRPWLIMVASAVSSLFTSTGLLIYLFCINVNFLFYENTSRLRWDRLWNIDFSASASAHSSHTAFFKVSWRILDVQ